MRKKEERVLGNVSDADFPFLYELNIHPKIRKVSHYKKVFPYSTHCAYWNKQLKNPKFKAKIILDEGKSIGCIRSDNGLISIAIHPDFQGKGIGTKALIKFTKRGHYTAEILATNPRSFHIFKKVGFKLKEWKLEK